MAPYMFFGGVGEWPPIISFKNSNFPKNLDCLSEDIGLILIRAILINIVMGSSS